MLGVKRRSRGLSSPTLAAGAICFVLVLFGSVAVAAGNPHVAGGGSESRTHSNSTDTRVPGLVNRLHNLKLVNYFPRNHSWRGMWTNWQPAILASDFAMSTG